MFIVIEGPDGSGKTTLAKQLTTQLKQLNKPTVYTYEPTFSKFGKKIAKYDANRKYRQQYL